MSESHTAKRPTKDCLISSFAAANLLGITPVQFRRMAKQKGLIPSGWYKNPNYRTGPQCPLWPEKRIKRLIGTKAVTEIGEKAKKRREVVAAKTIHRQADLQQRYPEPRQAIAAAC